MKDDLKSAGVALLFMAGACLFTTPTASGQAGFDQSNPGAAASADLYLKSGGRYDRAGELIGIPVLDRDNHAIGQVKEIVSDIQNGRVPLTIISLNDQSRLVAVPPSLLTPVPGHKALVLNVDQQTLAHAPSFSAGSWPDLSNSQWAGSVYSFYGQTAYWQSSPRGSGVEIREPAGAYRVPVWISGRDQDQLMDQVFRRFQRGKQAAWTTDQRIAASAPDMLYPQYPATAPATATGMNEPSGAQTALSPMARLTRTSDLIGASVRDSSGQTVGTVRDVVIDWPANRISYAVVTPTGLQGLPNQFLAVPPAALNRSGNDPTVYNMNVSSSKLNTAPGFSGTSWPEPSNQAFLSNVYAFYGQRPYWTAETGTIIGQ